MDCWQPPGCLQCPCIMEPEVDADGQVAFRCPAAACGSVMMWRRYVQSLLPQSSANSAAYPEAVSAAMEGAVSCGLAGAQAPPPPPPPPPLLPVDGDEKRSLQHGRSYWQNPTDRRPFDEKNWQNPTDRRPFDEKRSLQHYHSYWQNSTDRRPNEFQDEALQIVELGRGRSIEELNCSLPAAARWSRPSQTARSAPSDSGTTAGRLVLSLSIGLWFW